MLGSTHGAAMESRRGYSADKRQLISGADSLDGLGCFPDLAKLLSHFIEATKARRIPAKATNFLDGDSAGIDSRSTDGCADRGHCQNRYVIANLDLVGNANFA